MALIEFKAEGKRPKPMQLYMINLLAKLGWPVTWVDNKDDGIRFLQRIKSATLDS